MRKLTVVAVAACVVWMCGAQVMAQGKSERAEWKAEWITAPDVPQRDEVVLHFRKVIELKAAAEHFVVDVSADNAFVFYVNGKRVGTGPAKNDLGHWKYETYDVGPYLKAGKNVLAATVWNFGTKAAVAQMSDRTGFLVHGEAEAEREADTNASWEVEVEKGITALPVNLPGFYYAAGPGERWDAGKMDWSFAAEDVKDKGAWTKPVLLGRGAPRWERDAPNNWQLVNDPLPAMEMRQIPTGPMMRVEGKVARRRDLIVTVPTVAAGTKASFLVDQGELVTGYPELPVRGGAGSKIRLTYAEALVDEKGQKGNRNEIEGKHIFGVTDEFLPDGGDSRRFMPLGWRTWRYLQIDVEAGAEPVRIGLLKTWFSAYPFEEKGYFRSDDGMLGKIWEIGWRTARLDAHDTYMDTPYWERLQYIGDTRIQAMVTYAVSGDDRLPRQAIVAFNHSRIPDGLTQSRYPSQLVQMIPAFSLLWVGMVEDFWKYRGDAEFTKAQLPGLRTVMDWYLQRQRADGLLGRIPWWPFVDWGKDFDYGEPPQEADGQSAVITLQFVEALRYGAELEEAFGDKHVAETYRAAAEKAADGVWKLCWEENVGLLADTPAKRHYSQHANILGVWLDVIPRERQRVVLEKILSKSDTGFTASGAVPEMTLATYYFRYYLARAVEHAGMGERYLGLLGPWREMVGLGLTTWAEQPEPTRSDSHAWSAHPNFDLLRIVAGIRPAEAGFAKVKIEPHLGALQKVEAGMPRDDRGEVYDRGARVRGGSEVAGRSDGGIGVGGEDGGVAWGRTEGAGKGGKSKLENGKEWRTGSWVPRRKE